MKKIMLNDRFKKIKENRMVAITTVFFSLIFLCLISINIIKNNNVLATTIVESGVDTISMTLDSEGVFTVSGYGTLTSFPWKDYGSKVVKVIFNVTEGEEMYVDTCVNMFDNMNNLVEVDLDKLNTSKVTDMGYMFCNSRSLQIVKYENFDTSKVTSFYLMFAYCNSLKYVDVSNWGVSSASNMQSLFYDCYSLEYLDVSDWDVSSAENMLGIFCECRSLKNLDVSNWDVSSAQNMHRLFQGCSSITSLDLTNWQTPNLVDINNMFQNANSLKELDLSSFDMSNVTTADAFLTNATSIQVFKTPINCNISPVLPTTYYYGEVEYQTIPKVSESITLVSTKNTTWQEEWNYSLDLENEIITLNGYDGERTKISVPKYAIINGYYYQTKLGTATITSGPFYDKGDTFKSISIYIDYLPENMDYMFYNCSNLEFLNFEESYMSNTVTAENMIINSTKLKIFGLPLDCNIECIIPCDLQDINGNVYSTIPKVLSAYTLSVIPNSNTTWQEDWDYNLEKDYKSIVLTNYKGSEVDLTVPEFAVVDGQYYRTQLGNATTSSGPFYSKRTQFETISLEENVLLPNDSQYIFRELTSLTTLNINKISTSNVKSMYGMFAGCSKLTTVDISNFDTSNVITIQDIFANCSSLQYIDVSNFNTSNVTSIQGIFYNCTSLTKLDLSNFNTKNATNMRGIVENCNNLIEIDLSSFDTSNATEMRLMFSNCNSLKMIDISNFNMQNVNNYDNFFRNNSSLEVVKTPINCQVDIALPTTFYNGLNEYTSIPNVSESITLVSTLNTTWQEDWSYELDETDKIMNLQSYDSTSQSVIVRSYATFDGIYYETKLGASTSTSGPFYTNGSYITDLYFENIMLPETIDYMFVNCINLEYLTFNIDMEAVISAVNMLDACINLKILKTPINCKLEIKLPGNFRNNDFIYTKMPNTSTSLTLLSETLENTTWQEDWEYTLNAESETIILNSYKGDATELIVPDCAVIEDCYYQSELAGAGIYSGPFYAKKSQLNSIVFEKNVQLPASMAYMFNSSSIKSIDLSEVDFSNVTSIRWLFWYCTNLEEIKINFKNMKNLTDTSSAFYGCRKLTTLDLSELDTSKVTNFSSMFSGCSSLSELNISNFDTSSATTLASMFKGCSKLTSLDLSNFDTSNVTSLDATFNGCSSLTTLDLSSFNTSKVTGMPNAFNGCSKLTNLDLSNFDTSNVTTFWGTFAYCSSLTNLNVSSFDTSKVQYMYFTFRGCSSLTNLDVSNFDTSSVTTMAQMFQDCSKLTSLDLSNFDTSNTEHMDSMFWGCNSLTSLNLSNFDTSKVKNMYGMFCYCHNLESINLSNFETSNVERMDYMFTECFKLKELDVTNFDTSRVTNMYGMFSNCRLLTKLDINNFYTANLFDVGWMFYNTYSLTTLDMSSFTDGTIFYATVFAHNCKLIEDVNGQRVLVVQYNVFN